MITQVGKGGVVRPTVVIEEDLVNFDGRAKTAEELAEFTESLLDTRIPIGRTINNVPLDRDIVLTPEILDTYDRATIDQKIATAESSGYNPVKVNGHLLDKNVNLDASDLDAYSAQEIDSKLNFVPGTRTVNGKPLSADVTLTPGDVGAQTKIELDAAVAGIVPESRKVNGKPLSADVTLTPGDVGAPTPAETVPRTFTINGQAMTGTEMTVTLDSSAYTKAELDTKLTGYIKLDNAWGLGTAPKVDVVASGSGFFGYVAASTPPGSSKGTTAYIFSADTSYGLAFPEDQDSPQYYNGTWHAVSSGNKAPIPDVWLPLEDSLRMITGDGPFDKVTINGSSLDLHTKSAAFTRASTASYIGKDGIVKYAAVNEPRFEQEGLLMEYQSTNHVPTQTIQPSPGYLEVTYNQESPDGSNLGTKVKSLANPILIQPITSDGGYLTMSWYLKPINGTMFSALFRNGTKGIDLEREDIIFTNGVPAISNPNSTITKLANGWYRHTLTQAPRPDTVSGDAMTVYFGLTGGESVGREYYIFGMQIERGSIASSYIPTLGTPATRAGDTCSIQSPGNFPGKDFTLAMNVDFKPIDNYPFRRMLFSATSYYAFGFQRPTSGDAGGQAFVYMGQNGDSGVYRPINGLNIHTFDQSKPLVLKVATGNTTTYNGKTYTTVGITPVMPVGSTLYLGNDPTEGTGSYLNGHVRNVRIWLNQLSDSEIGALV